MRRFLVATLLVLLLPNAASASTLTGEKDEGGTTIFTYAAGPGETNVVDVAITARKITVTDPGATIQTSGSCTVAGNVATCPTPKFFGFVAGLGDGDDSLTLPAAADGGGIVARRVDGGTGNDTLDASAMVLVGGEGDDTLSSARVDARFSGGPGTDALTGTNDSQDFQGGPGQDTISAGDGDGQIASYAEATAAVTADLREQGAMGPAGDQDTVTGIDGVIGGKGDDLLTGDGQGNKLVGGAGDDEIDAGGGPDDVVAGKGDDEIAGGGGRDVIRDTAADAGSGTTIDGGGGSDEIRATGGPSFVQGGLGNDELILGAKLKRASGDDGDDVLFARNEPVAPLELSCGEGDDVAEDFGRTAVSRDCEELGFRSTKLGLSIPNVVTLDGNELTVPVPNLCLEACRVRASVIVVDTAEGEQTIQLKKRRNGEVTFTVGKATRRALGKLGAATILYEPPRGSFFGSYYVTFTLP